MSIHRLQRPLRTLAAVRPLTGLLYRDLVLPVAAGSATLLSALALTVVSAWLITRAWGMPPVMELTLAVTAVRALGISRAVFRYTDRLAAHRVALQCAGTARVNTYRMVASASPAQSAALGRGTLITRLTTDIDAVSDVIVRAVIPALVSLVTGGAAVLFTAALSVPAAIVLAVGLGISGLLAPWAVSRSVQASEQDRAQRVDEYATAVDRVLSDSAVLRVRGHLDSALAHASTAAHGLTRAQEAGAPARAAGAGVSILASAGTAVGVLVVAILGYSSSDAGGAIAVHSPQWFGVLVLLSLAAFEATAALPEAAAAVSRASGATARLAAIQENGRSGLSSVDGDCAHTASSASTVSSASSTSSMGAISATPHLRAQRLQYGYDHLLGTVDLDLPFGSRHTITAASGTGKTTLLLTLAGLIPALGGNITFDGVTCSDPQKVIAYCPEDAHIFATTVRDNLAVGAPDASDALMASTLASVGLWDWVKGLPHGLSTILPLGAESLSGGQRRRLLLARMLLTPAPILALDEPFEHMDAAGSAELESLLSAPELPRARAVRTVVVVRHPRSMNR